MELSTSFDDLKRCFLLIKTIPTAAKVTMLIEMIRIVARSFPPCGGLSVVLVVVVVVVELDDC